MRSNRGKERERERERGREKNFCLSFRIKKEDGVREKTTEMKIIIEKFKGVKF